MQTISNENENKEINKSEKKQKTKKNNPGKYVNKNYNQKYIKLINTTIFIVLTTYYLI